MRKGTMWSHLHGYLKMFSHKRHQGMSAMLCSGNQSLQTQSISLASSSAVWTADTLMFLALSSASLSFCFCSLLGLPQPHQCRLLCRRLSDRLRRPPRESQPGPADGSDFVRCHAVCGGGIHHPGPASREARHTRLSFNTWDVSVWLCFYWSWQCRDAGGSMVIHAFGGYYGLGISWVLYRPNLHQSKRLNGSVYHSDVFAMIGAYLAHSLSSCQHFMLFFFFSSNRDSVPLDVLAQFQLRHHRPRRWTAQSCHQHIPGAGLLRAHHRGALQHAWQARKAGHGDSVWWRSHHSWLVFLVTNMLLFLAGAHPKCHTRRRCRHGNISWVHDHPLWCSDRGFLLRHHLHLWLSLRHGELVYWFDKLELFIFLVSGQNKQRKYKG